MVSELNHRLGRRAMIIINGHPKSGTHALVKAVQLLGVPCYVEHRPHKTGLRDGERCLFIKRDPRNICLSWLRFCGQPETPGMWLTYFRRFEDKSLVDSLAQFEGWLTDPQTCAVRFEDLIASEGEHRKIADWLGVSYFAGAWEQLPGLTPTWTGRLSDYRTIWTPEVESAWQAEGGPELLSRWGY